MFQTKREQIVRYGFEIECILNRGIFDIEKGSRHEGLPFGLTNWKAEPDGSIHQEARFNSELEVEFVSAIAQGKKEAIKYLEQFKRYFSKNGDLKLKDVMYFNNSCGAHIHFSPVNQDIIFKRDVYELFAGLKKSLFNALDSSSLKVDIIKGIKCHYNRDYARPLYSPQEAKEWRQLGTKYMEVNFKSREENKGLEWRSPSLLNITTWDEFMELYRIYLDCLEYLIGVMSSPNKIIRKLDLPNPVSNTRKMRSLNISFELTKRSWANRICLDLNPIQIKSSKTQNPQSTTNWHIIKEELENDLGSLVLLMPNNTQTDILYYIGDTPYIVPPYTALFFKPEHNPRIITVDSRKVVQRVRVLDEEQLSLLNQQIRSTPDNV